MHWADRRKIADATDRLAARIRATHSIRCTYFQDGALSRWHASCCQLEANRIVASRCEREIVVSLIVYYVVFMIAGDFAAYFIGLFVEYEWGSQASLIVFLALYFLFLWVSWVLAVWVTKPTETAEVAG